MVVVGSGAAGIAAALSAAAAGLRVLVVTKDLIGGATPLAQGGLAAAIGPLDSVAAHAEDTLTAGAGLCEPAVVTALASGAPGAIEWLAGLGARLETWELRLEGGHSARRIVHSGDDATGAEVHRALLAALLASGIEILDRTIALDLRTRDLGRRVTGLVAARIGPNGRLEPGVIDAPAVVIAAGGLGQAFATTSNPAGATGDGIALAARAGAVLRDLEFVQFHPTVLWLPQASGQCPLITEALRGAGAVLRDLDGTPVMAGQHPRGDLAPRDVVAARMAEVIGAGTAGHVWLDATGLGRELLEQGFPTVTAACRKHGIDPVTEYIPVAPGAHYSCGGIRADLDGRTSIPGLYAVGEAASTGVQGANRLASNSVTEAIIAGRRAGESLAGVIAGLEATVAGAVGLEAMAAGAVGLEAMAAGAVGLEATVTGAVGLEATVTGAVGLDAGAGTLVAVDVGAGSADAGTARAGTAVTGAAGVGRERVAGGRRELAAAMSRDAGVLRDADGLTRLVALASVAPSGAVAPSGVVTSMGSVASWTWGADVDGEESAGIVPAEPDLDLDLEEVEAANLRTVSALIAAGALRRGESRGCHRRRDAPATAERPRHTLLRWDGRNLMVTEEEL